MERKTGRSKKWIADGDILISTKTEHFLAARVFQREPFAKVRGYRCKIVPWLETFVYSLGNRYWCVCEMSAGLAVPIDVQAPEEPDRRSRKKMVRNAKYVLEEQGESTVKKAVKSHKKCDYSVIAQLPLEYHGKGEKE